MMRTDALRSLPATGITHENHRLSLCLLLSLLLLLLYAHDHWYINLPLSVLAIVGFIFQKFLSSRILWSLSTAIIALGTYANWYMLDNHKYLLGYWCLAICLSVFTSDPERSLARSARLMIGAVFLLAVGQKTFSDSYMDGTFFYYELLFDERFAGLAKFLAGLPDHFADMNGAARLALTSFDSTLMTVQLQGTLGVAKLALLITWWNYLIQAIIALAFLTPGGGWLARTRDVWLLLFLFTTYLVAPVIGFGWVLAIMGIAQTEREAALTRGWYLASFLVLQIYRVPWREVIFWLTPGA